jgi:hypothetical protein
MAMMPKQATISPIHVFPVVGGLACTRVMDRLSVETAFQRQTLRGLAEPAAGPAPSINPSDHRISPVKTISA